MCVECHPDDPLYLELVQSQLDILLYQQTEILYFQHRDNRLKKS